MKPADYRACAYFAGFVLFALLAPHAVARYLGA